MKQQKWARRRIGWRTFRLRTSILTASLAKKLGGKVYKEPTDIPSVGRFAVIADPQGAVIVDFHPE